MQRCPICQTEVPASPRYPRYVCAGCAAKAASADGRPLSFSNTSFSGGYRAWFTGSTEEYLDHRCFVEGIPCWADEAHMGGIVIQPVSKDPKGLGDP